MEKTIIFLCLLIFNSPILFSQKVVESGTVEFYNLWNIPITAELKYMNNTVSQKKAIDRRWEWPNEEKNYPARLNHSLEYSDLINSVVLARYDAASFEIEFSNVWWLASVETFAKQIYRKDGIAREWNNLRDSLALLVNNERFGEIVKYILTVSELRSLTEDERECIELGYSFYETFGDYYQFTKYSPRLLVMYERLFNNQLIGQIKVSDLIYKRNYPRWVLDFGWLPYNMHRFEKLEPIDSFAFVSNGMNSPFILRASRFVELKNSKRDYEGSRMLSIGISRGSIQWKNQMVDSLTSNRVGSRLVQGTVGYMMSTEIPQKKFSTILAIEGGLTVNALQYFNFTQDTTQLTIESKERLVVKSAGMYFMLCAGLKLGTIWIKAWYGGGTSIPFHGKSELGNLNYGSAILSIGIPLYAVTRYYYY